MAKLVMVLLAALLVVGKGPVSDGKKIKMRDRMSAVEANQSTIREELQSLEQKHDHDMQNLKQLYLSLNDSLEEQKEVLANVQRLLQDNGQHNSLPEGPCKPDQHEVLDEDWRLTNNTVQSPIKCDNTLQPGWYRFDINGSNVAIPTSCVEKNRCQTHAPQWVDLQGKPLPGVNQETEALACAHWMDDCCNWNSSITVRNCGGYFVYKLQPKKMICHLAYCVDPLE